MTVATPVAESRGHKRRWVWLAAGLAALLVAGGGAWSLFPVTQPKVTGSTQITHDGYNMGRMVTDGSRIYGIQLRPEGNVLAEVSVTGGETVVIPTPIKNVELSDISPDHSQLLVTTFASTGTQDLPFWVLPLPAGSPRRLGDIVATRASWSRDGQQLVFTKGSALYLANAEGSNPHLLVSVQGFPAGARFSPDGSRIRFYIVGEANTQSLWEVRSDGSDLHQVFAGWHNPPSECCGSWTPDGRYYIFESASGSENNLYALQEGVHRSLSKGFPKTGSTNNGAASVFDCRARARW